MLYRRNPTLRWPEIDMATGSLTPARIMFLIPDLRMS